jgi:hypothetical protein
VKYERYPMVSFMLLKSRKDRVRLFVDAYAQALAQFPNLHEISAIGHSNGTYIIATALKDYDAIKLNNVYFAGSVMPESFDWSDLRASGRVQKVRNDMAAGDWVVAWFPKFYQQIMTTPLFTWTDFFDLGSAGFDGFKDQTVTNIWWFPGAHGAAIDDDMNKPSVIDFIINGKDQRRGCVPPGPGVRLDCRPDRVVDALGNMSWIVWLVLAGAAFGLGYLIRYGARRTNLIAPVWALLGYGCLLLLFLNTV